MSEWRTLTLGQICDEGGGLVRTGPFGSQLHQSDYSETGTPVVMPQDLIDGRASEQNIARIHQKHVERLAHHKLLVGDIVYGRRGDIGRKAFVTDREEGWLCGTGCLRISPGKGVVDPRFLFYALGAPGTVEAIKRKAVGATMPNLNTTILREVPLRIPWLPLQSRIASILGAYDDLIEVNRRRIELLEEMARRVFEEWFVKLRFPRHEAVKSIKGEKVTPAGWSWVRLDAIATVNGDTIRPASAPRRIGYIDISSVSPGNIERVEWLDFDSAPGRARRRVRDGSILWSSVRPNRRSFAAVLSPQPDTVASTGFAVIDAPLALFPYLYHWVTTDEFVGYLVGNATGAAYPAVTGAVFERAQVLWPPEGLIQLFGSHAEPMMRLGANLRNANSLLAAARDLLLPRLISGEVALAAAQRELEAAA